MRLIGVLLLALLPSVAKASGYCEQLTIDHTRIPNTDQTNFPLLVHGTYWWMADVAHSGFAVTGNNAHDIRFYSDSGCTASLDFQRIYWTNTTGESSWRVRIPTASHTTNTPIYVKIGSSADTADLSTTWMGSYGYVGFYAGGDPASVVSTDSGSANLTLSCSASVAATTSPVGGGFYVGSTQSDLSTCGYASSTPGETLASHGYPVGSTAGHIRYWFKNTASTSTGGTFNDVTPAAYGKANSTGQRGLETEYRTCQLSGLGEQQLSVPGPGIVTVNNVSSCSGNSSTPLYVMDVGNWHVFDFDQPTNGATYSATALYFDAVKITSPNFWDATGSSVINTADAACCTNVSEIRLGRMAAHGVGWFNGYVAQFEVTNFSWSADLVTTRDNNETSPDTFYAFTTNLPLRASGITASGVHMQ